MSDDFDTHRYSGPPPGAPPAAPSAASSRLRGTTLLKALRTVPKFGDRNFLAGVRSHPAIGLLRRHWAFAVFLILLLFPLAGVLLGFLARPSGSAASQAAAGITTSTDTGEKAKPAPGKGRLPQPQGPPPAVMHQPPSSALESQSPPPMEVPARPVMPTPGVPNPSPNAPPPNPAAAANAPYTPTVYSARHDKVFGEGCAGQLTLDSNGFVFRCPDDPRNSVQVALGDIESVDGNGVRLVSGKKYHFSIAGMGKSNVEQLFGNWLRRVR